MKPSSRSAVTSCVVVLHQRDPDQRAQRSRQLTLGEPGHGAVVEHAEPTG